ncbi:ABC-type polysaccharide transport system permease subunit [Kineothrix alysoides]|uniref:ABC-type polysaccharide transport system permease subunit n=1 Tax=Kineothrix alysoides TaxID=1469948 RepID=A0A4R1QYD8_9FIRM|nr:ABC transporter permease subunit [Kineothrix alysoides]TCL57240.1 ABC-type polysaccharide transport system permease subunit [Kineothrix alysoides]
MKEKIKGLSRGNQFLNKELANRKTGVFLTAAVSVVAIILSLPFFSWISIVNIPALFSKLSITREMAENLFQGYSLFNLLSFVQESKQGSLGLYAMILLILMAAALYFNVAYALKIAFNLKGNKGNLGLYATGQTAMLFEMIATAATAGFVIFANYKFGMTGMQASPVVYILFLLSLLSFAAIKLLEAEERALYKEHGLFREIQKNWVLFLMLVPTFIYFMINNYLPMLGVYYAFTSFNFRDGLWASPFIGFKNFDFLVKADLFRLTKNTILYNVVFIGLGNALQIVFAIFVSQVTVKWFKKASQTLMFMPYFVSFVILKVLVYNIFEYQYGLINNIITSAGGGKIDFYNTPSYWPVLITLFYLWKNIGYGMVVYLATIMGIDSEYYEAAKVDGANIFQQIWYITLPLVKPTFIILLLYALGSIMKGQFELFYQMIGNNGTLYNVTDIFDTYVYRITMTQPLSIGLGTAAGLYQSVFGFAIVILTNFLVKRKNPEYALF